MGIIYTENENIFTLNTANTTYQMKVDKYGYLLHLYYGRKAGGSMEYLLTYADRGFSGNPYEAEMDKTYSLDFLPQELPTQGTGDYRSPALVVKNADGSYGCRLRYCGHNILNEKYALKGLPAVYSEGEEAQTLEIYMEDEVSHVKVTLLYGVLPKKDIITRSAIINNDGEGKIYLEKAQAACLELLPGDYDLISFYGRHTLERNMQRAEINHGAHVIGSRRGTSSHQYNPMMIIAEKETTENAGGCYAMSFVYSGGFKGEAEKDQYNQTRVLLGLNDEQFSYPLEKGESFYVPEVILTYTHLGLGQLSNNLHECIRKNICRGKYRDSVRPVLLNSWEASYFDFDGEAIYRLAVQAAELGVDMLVMDDGWFGKRDNDISGLGDWYINEKKLGMPLSTLVDKVNGLGLKFGIWFEPESVNEDSDLYRKHPDWAFVVPGRKPVRSRYQLVLDFSRTEVVDYIFERVCNVLDSANIQYVKWDMNRSLCDCYSLGTSEQGRVMHDYVLGLYDFLERFVSRYPDILLEGCSGGGGRFDAGMLYYAPQIWCSDNTDALDRIKIQYGTSFGYPSCTVASHVSTIPNHQTGRSTPFYTRTVTAMAGMFGYELNPSTLSETDRQGIREDIWLYKKYAPLIMNGLYYRLTNPYKDEAAVWEYVSKDKSEVLVSAVMLEIHGNMTVNYIRLKGLEENCSYREENSGKEYNSNALMEAGIPLPIEMGEYKAYQMYFVKI
jgi:alpha-galactosidase